MNKVISSFNPDGPGVVDGALLDVQQLVEKFVGELASLQLLAVGYLVVLALITDALNWTNNDRSPCSENFLDLSLKSTVLCHSEVPR